MVDVLRLIWGAIADFFRPRADLQAEIIALRHQLNVLRRKRPERLVFGNSDRLLFVWLYRLAPGTLNVLSIVKPETVIGWRRRGFRAFWRWKSRSRAGRSKTPLEIRTLIWTVSIVNPLWGAPRIHGELSKLGINVGQTAVAKYMSRPGRPPSQGWKTFFRSHADGIVAMDLFVVPAISFKLLYGLVVMNHDRRKVLHLSTQGNRAKKSVTKG